MLTSDNGPSPLKRYMKDGATPPGSVGTHRFVVSDAPDHFLRQGQRFLGAAIDDVEKVTLG